MDEPPDGVTPRGLRDAARRGTRQRAPRACVPVGAVSAVDDRVAAGHRVLDRCVGCQVHAHELDAEARDARRAGGTVVGAAHVHAVRE
jgi:hypothetical protein